MCAHLPSGVKGAESLSSLGEVVGVVVDDSADAHGRPHTAAVHWVHLCKRLPHDMKHHSHVMSCSRDQGEFPGTKIVMG